MSNEYGGRAPLSTQHSALNRARQAAPLQHSEDTVPVTMRSSASQRTYSPKKAELVHAWHVLDAEGQTLGRLATQAASLLRGKHNPRYVPHMDCGDYVVIVNAEKIVVTGRKSGQKMYYRHSGYPGGL